MDKPYLFERCVTGDIAELLCKYAKLLRVTTLNRFQLDGLLNLVKEIINAPGVYAAQTNAERFTSGKDFGGKDYLYCKIFSFHKVGHMSRPSFIEFAIGPQMLDFAARSLPLLLHSAHIQYRHSEDRANKALDFGDDFFITSCLMSLLVSAAADKNAGDQQIPAILPMEEGLLLGYMQPVDAATPTTNFLRLLAARNLNTKQYWGEKLEKAEWTPQHDMVLKTFYGFSQMSGGQRQLHNTLNSIFSDHSSGIEQIFGAYTSGKPFTEAFKASKAGAKIVNKNMEQVADLKRTAGQLTTVGHNKMEAGGTTSEHVQNLELCIGKLAEILKSPAWRSASNIPIYTPQQVVS